MKNFTLIVGALLLMLMKFCDSNPPSKDVLPPYLDLLPRTDGYQPQLPPTNVDEYFYNNYYNVCRSGIEGQEDRDADALCKAANPIFSGDCRLFIVKLSAQNVPNLGNFRYYNKTIATCFTPNGQLAFCATKANSTEKVYIWRPFRGYFLAETGETKYMTFCEPEQEDVRQKPSAPVSGAIRGGYKDTGASGSGSGRKSGKPPRHPAPAPYYYYQSQTRRGQR